MSTNLTINAIVKLSKNTNGEVPLYLRLTFNKDRSELSLQRWIPVKNWDPALKRATGSGSNRINDFIEEEKAYIRSIKRELDIKDKPYTLSKIKDIYLGKKESHKEFLLDRFQNHIKYMEGLVGISFNSSTIKNYKVTFNHLKEFVLAVSGNDILITDVNNQFVKNFDSFLRRDKKHAHNTAVKNLKRLKKVVGECLADGILTIDPFKRTKLGYKSGNREPLSEPELYNLINKEFKLDKLNRVKDVFVFCCLTGLSYADVKELTNNNLLEQKGDLIIKGRRQKTKEEFTIYVLPTANKLIQKYRNHPLCNQKGILFPVLSNQKMNDLLKEIALILEIEKNLTCHIARYTFITTVMAANGISGPITGAAAGQASSRITDHYTKLKEMNVVKQMKQLSDKY